MLWVKRDASGVGLDGDACVAEVGEEVLQGVGVFPWGKSAVCCRSGSLWDG